MGYNQESTKTIIRMLITKSNTLWLIYYMHFAAAHDGVLLLGIIKPTSGEIDFWNRRKIGIQISNAYNTDRQAQKK
jgi:hypothetical protein